MQCQTGAARRSPTALLSATKEFPNLEALDVSAADYARRFKEGKDMTGSSPIGRLLSLTAVCGLAAALAGCAGNIARMEQAQASGGTPFTQALTEEYRSFVAHEKDERDWTAADYFAAKGLAAAGGQVVLPEQVPEAGEHTQALTEARKRLMEALDGGADARTYAPAAAARAQRAFDYWQHEAHEDYRYDALTDAHVAPCRKVFEAAISQLPTMIVEPPAPTIYVVLFDFDSTKITGAGKAVIDQALIDAARMPRVVVAATGHADRSGTEACNLALSLRRADAVRAALITGGISPDAITVAGRGESEPAVPTADGAKEPANRRVVIILQ
jgi:OmpA-OmpF porin, OOP family